MISDQDKRYLNRLSEECAEVSQMVSKVFRFGPYSRHPTRPEEGTNIERLEGELGDLIAVVKMLVDAGVLDLDRITAHTEKKYDTTKHVL